MGAQLDMDKIAEALGAERRGKVSAKGGYFGAVQLAAEVEERFRTPPGGGRATNPEWTEQRLVRLSPGTLKRLERVAKQISEQKGGTRLEPLQLAALLLEKATDQL